MPKLLVGQYICQIWAVREPHSIAACWGAYYEITLVGDRTVLRAANLPESHPSTAEAIESGRLVAEEAIRQLTKVEDERISASIGSAICGPAPAQSSAGEVTDWMPHIKTELRKVPYRENP